MLFSAYNARVKEKMEEGGHQKACGEMRLYRIQARIQNCLDADLYREDISAVRLKIYRAPGAIAGKPDSYRNHARVNVCRSAGAVAA